MPNASLIIVAGTCDEPRASVNNIEYALSPLGALIVNPAPRLGVVASGAASEAGVTLFALTTLHFNSAVAPLRLLLVRIAPRPVLSLFKALEVLLAPETAREVAHGTKRRVTSCDGHCEFTKSPTAGVGGGVTPRPVPALGRACVVHH